MPVTLAPPAPEAAVVNLRERRLRRGSIRDRGRRLGVGLINNMPDSALAATERQFRGLLEDASGDFDVQLSLFSLPSLPREAQARRAMAVAYRNARDLRGAGRDALIVTGTEPKTPDLRDEPYWRDLVALIDWSETHTLSSLFSCLAAHAAVLHRDGVGRKRLPAKCSGVFSVKVAARHELTEGLEGALAVPHSRKNGLDETELAAAGYVTLTRAENAGVDLFVKEAAGLSVFLQGHPEYEPDTLAREYRRDALRFWRGESDAPPPAPRNYFPPELAARLAALVATPGGAALEFPAEALHIEAAPWRATSVRLYRNWLASVARRKLASQGPSFATARWGG